MDELIAKWNEILEKVRIEYDITNVSFEAWLKPLEVFDIENDTLLILYTNETSRMGTISFIEKRYKKILEVCIEDVTGHKYNTKFIIPKEAISMKPGTASYNNNDQVPQESTLMAKYTFDSFVVGNSNRFAQNAALAVAESPGETYNPLYIYGGPGLGKTHLLHAIGNFIYNQDPSKRILYVTSEQFVNEVIEGIRNNKNGTAMSSLREKYRTVDVLMIDDIQFIIGKEQTQEEFFYTFNALDDAGKQIIISSDRPPKDFEILESRIKSRFEKGLMADIGYPDYETRMAIILKKMENSDITIPEEVCNYVAEHIKSNIREIEGALTKLIAYARMEHREITIEIAEKELAAIISPDKPKEVTPQMIIEIVADHYGITVDDMCSKNRSKTIALPRQVAMYLCQKLTNKPFKAIGQFLGGKDHSTIIHGCKKISEEYENNSEIRMQIDTIIKKINPN